MAFKGIPKLPKSTLVLKEVSKPVDHEVVSDSNSDYSINNPFLAKMVNAKNLTQARALKKCLHLELDISQSGISFVPGDSFGILCPNSSIETIELLKKLQMDTSKSYNLSVSEGTLPPHLSTHKVHTAVTLLNTVDIRTIPKKVFLRVLVEYTSDPAQKNDLLYLSSRDGTDSYRKIFMETPNPPDLLNLLNEFSSCSPPLEVLIENLPPLKPRYYSVTNSFLQHPNQIHIAFNIVEYEIIRSPWKHFLPSALDNKEPSDIIDPEESKKSTQTQKRFGLCTSWLDELSQVVHTKIINNNNTEEHKIKEVYVPIFKKPINEFKLPSVFDSDKEEDIPPVIMVGAGTGVAPFRSFLQHIHHVKKHGETWLFSGCRNKELDFIYGEDFEKYHKEGTLSHFISAFSRDTPEKLYVQHKLEEYGKEICDLLLNKNAYLFLCGDAKGLANGVFAMLVQILTKYGNMDEKTAQEKLQELSKAKRYIIDVWS